MKNLLKSGRILLRALEPEDIDLLYSWENNTEIWGLSNTRKPFSRYILAKYIHESGGDIYETGQLRLIIQNEKGIPVGAVDLFDIDIFHQRAGLGILIHNPEERRKGYASDTLAALSSYCLNIIGLRQLYAEIPAGNSDSHALFRKAGFRKTGIKKEWLKTAAGWEDEIIYQKFLG